jgi:hypothetical protein
MDKLSQIPIYQHKRHAEDTKRFCNSPQGNTNRLITESGFANLGLEWRMGLSG